MCDWNIFSREYKLVSKFFESHRKMKRNQIFKKYHSKLSFTQTKVLKVKSSGNQLGKEIFLQNLPLNTLYLHFKERKFSYFLYSIFKMRIVLYNKIHNNEDWQHKHTHSLNLMIVKAKKKDWIAFKQAQATRYFACSFFSSQLQL